MGGHKKVKESKGYTVTHTHSNIQQYTTVIYNSNIQQYNSSDIYKTTIERAGLYE